MRDPAMIAALPVKGKKFAVLGLARSGLVTAGALRAAGAEVVAWDDGAAGRAKGETAGLDLVDLATSEPLDWSALVMSPGIPLTHPVPHPAAARARAAGIEIIGDIELLARANASTNAGAGTEAAFIGITGTNGKSTTTALIGHILTESGTPTAIGGNLGVPVLSLPKLRSDGQYVIELSSFQLDLVTTLRAHIGILLNVTPDHLDRHGDMAGYVAVKERLFAHQQAGDAAIVAVDDDHTRAVAGRLAETPARLIRVSAEQEIPGGVYIRHGWLIDDLDGAAVAVMDLATAQALPGAHNHQNAAAAYAACRHRGLGPQAIAAGILTYPGLAHRQERVATLDGIRFVNDSKATNADAAAKALGCYDRIYWIAGGRAKAGGIRTLEAYFPRVAHAFLIGEAAADFAATLKGKVETTLSGTLDAAVRQAADMAATSGENAVVLFSPACASYDQFSGFEARGDAFRTLALRLTAGNDGR